VRLRVPLSRSWPLPTLDGRTSSFFEWAVAAWVDGPPSHRLLARAALRASENRLFLRVEPRPGLSAPVPLVVTVVAQGQPSSWTLPADLAPAECGVGACVEACLPVSGGDLLVAVEHRGERLPAEGFWRLELQEVDEP
jgi:hypothetical protein